MRQTPEQGFPADGNSEVEAALADCRTTLEHCLADLREDYPRQAALESARTHLASFAETAARHDVPPERMIVMLKRMVRELPPVLRWRDTERDNISHELVEMTIAAYYGLNGDDGRRKS